MVLHSSPHPSLGSRSSGSHVRRPLATKTNFAVRSSPLSPAAAVAAAGASGVKGKGKGKAAAHRPAQATATVNGTRRGKGQAPKKRTRRDGTRRDDPVPRDGGKGGGSRRLESRKITPIELDNDEFGFGTSLAVTWRTRSSLRRITPPSQPLTQQPLSLSSFLSDLPSTPSTHRPSSDVEAAEERIDELLGRKRRAGTPKHERAGKKKARDGGQVKANANGAGKRKGMRTRHNDLESEADSASDEGGCGGGEEDEDDMILDVPVESAAHLTSPTPDDSATTIDVPDSTTPKRKDQGLHAPLDKSSTISLASDDFYS